VREISLDGRLSALSGACPAISFTLENRRVYTTTATEFSRGPCRDVRSGMRVDVRGHLMSDGLVRAATVRLEKDDDDDDEE
jgi:hypothetical protein